MSQASSVTVIVNVHLSYTTLGKIGAKAPSSQSCKDAHLCAANLDRRDTTPAPQFSTGVNASQRPFVYFALWGGSRYGWERR